MRRFYKEPAKLFNCGMLLKIPLLRALDFLGNLNDSLISGEIASVRPGQRKAHRKVRFTFF
jgi:hypothetical protein